MCVRALNEWQIAESYMAECYSECGGLQFSQTWPFSTVELVPSMPLENMAQAVSAEHVVSQEWLPHAIALARQPIGDNEFDPEGDKKQQLAHSLDGNAGGSRQLEDVSISQRRQKKIKWPRFCWTNRESTSGIDKKSALGLTECLCEWVWMRPMLICS